MQLIDFVDAFDANMYLNAAVQLGLSYRILKDRGDFFEIYNTEKVLRFNNTSLSINDCVSSAYIDDKYFILNKFAELGFKVPKHALFDLAETERILEYARDNMPLVIKPNDLCQSIGVFTKVDSEEKLLAGLSELKKLKIKKVLLEEQINAKLYRLIYLNGKLLEIICKEPASVTGDGRRAIRELIDENNLIRGKVVTGVSFRPDEECRKFLAESYGYDFETKLEPNEKIYLSAIPDFTNGGISEKILLGAIPPENSRTCYEIYRHCNLPFCGIDVFCDDITNEKCDVTLNEINSSLGIRINFYADLKPTLELPVKILSEYFQIESDC